MSNMRRFFGFSLVLAALVLSSSALATEALPHCDKGHKECCAQHKDCCEKKAHSVCDKSAGDHAAPQDRSPVAVLDPLAELKGPAADHPKCLHHAASSDFTSNSLDQSAPQSAKGCCDSNHCAKQEAPAKK